MNDIFWKVLVMGTDDYMLMMFWITVWIQVFLNNKGRDRGN